MEVEDNHTVEDQNYLRLKTGAQLLALHRYEQVIARNQRDDIFDLQITGKYNALSEPTHKPQKSSKNAAFFQLICLLKFELHVSDRQKIADFGHYVNHSYHMFGSYKASEFWWQNLNPLDLEWEGLGGYDGEVDY